MTQMLYDAVGRVTDVIKQLNGGIKQTIAQKAYDDLGRLKTKRLHVNGSSQLETLNYEYNIHGWLKSINKGYVNTPTSYTSWFGQELFYDYGFTANQVNGNIAGIKWKSGGDSKGRAYGYAYDNANRLTVADFTQNNTAGSKVWDRNQQDYSVDQLTYDANGNILSERQRGMDGTSMLTIDSLKYGYQLNSNKLSFVTDKKNNSLSKLGDFKEINNNETVDYAYDSSGNMIKDLNKNIAVIRYNHLNLPDSIAITGKGSIRFVYDAAGGKLRKIVTDNTTSTPKITTTDYIGGIIYRNDTMDLISHEEGRIRPVYQSGQPIKYYYDYFLKDHLGDVRTVLTEQTDLTVYTATMEAANALTETELFSNVEDTRAIKPVGYPADQSMSENQYIAKLNAKDGGKKIGPSLVLRVMAGDTIQIGARAFYKSSGPKNNKSVSPEDMVAGLLQAFGGAAVSNSSHAAGQANRTSPFSNFNGSVYQRLKEKDPNENNQDRPKAYLNFVLFDDQFNLVEENSGLRQVKGEPDELQTLAVDKMPVRKSGLLYVYTSNETQQDVLFDNVTITAINGPLLEETHYYPFGLIMEGISSNALKGTSYPENRYLFNGKQINKNEFEGGTGLHWYDYGNREYDPQIGRFFRIDPLTTDYVQLTPYQYAGNEPIRNIDLDGLEPLAAVEAWNLATAQSHTYRNGQKAFFIDGYWVNVQRGDYNTVYQYHEKGNGWSEFTPKTNEDYGRARARALNDLAQGMALTAATAANLGGSLFTGGFAIPGLTATTLGAGAADAGAQLMFSNKPTFGEKLADINVTSVAGSILFKNPATGGLVGSVGDWRWGDGFSNSPFSTSKDAKSFETVLIESGVGTVFGYAAEKGTNHLGLGSYSTIKGMITGGLNKTGVVTLHFGASGLTELHFNTLATMISDILNDANKKQKSETDKK